MNTETLRTIESYGERFKEEYLDKWEKKRLSSDWTYALEFFFDHSFMRGRNDKLSLRFKDATLAVLRKTLFITQDYNLERLAEELTQGKVNNFKDRQMVCDVVRFIRTSEQQNIVAYFTKKLSKAPEEAYKELTDIAQIGDKIATLYIRDLCWLFDIPINNSALVFPIDTWLEKIVKRIGLCESNENNKQRIKASAINTLKQAHIDPTRFNAGAWYLGTHSLELLLEHLDKLKK